MSHCDPSILALAALGEDIPSDESAHLYACEACLADVATLAEVVMIGREAPQELVEVPDAVWVGITRELSLVGAPDGDASRPVVPPAPFTSNPSAPAEPLSAPQAEVIPLAPRRARRSSWSVMAVAAAVGALVGGTVVWSAVDRGGGASTGGQDVFLAQAVLEPLADTVSSPGEATVLDSPDGKVVRVDAGTLPPNDGFYEVWLLDADATKLVALGALPAGSVGTFTVPPGLSIADFPIVDISLETYDGDPSHSKNSLMRGVLEA
ncbi:MAG: anti-sigma factor [Candidatus Nanopelagicales bacterium]